MIDGFGDLFAFDSRLLRTLKPLIARPGLLTTEFMAGRRARYVPPFRLYVFISILMFVLLGLSGHSFIIYGDETDGVIRAGFRFSGAADEDAPSAAEDSTSGAATDFEPDSEEGWSQRLNDSLAALGDDPEGFNRAFGNRLAQSFFVLLPIVALFLKGLFWRPRRPYLHHLIFALHLHSLAFLLIATTVAIGMALPDGWSISVVVPFWVLIYLILSLRRVYGQGWLRIGVKTGLLLFAYFLTLSLTMVAAMVVVALF